MLPTTSQSLAQPAPITQLAARHHVAAAAELAQRYRQQKAAQARAEFEDTAPQRLAELTDAALQMRRETQPQPAPPPVPQDFQTSTSAEHGRVIRAGSLRVPV